MTIRNLLLSLCFAVQVTACGSSDAAGGSDGGTSTDGAVVRGDSSIAFEDGMVVGDLPIDKLVDALFGSICGVDARCRGGEREFGGFCDVSLQESTALFESYVAAAMRGDYVYDEALAKACVDLLLNAGCVEAQSATWLSETFAEGPCREMLRGAVELGGGCQDLRRSVCKEGYCQRADASCGGACVALPQIGQPCATLRATRDARCAEGLRCLDGVCTERANEGAPCSANGDCAADLSCRGSVCVSHATKGESCDANKPCTDDFYCAAGTCADKLDPGEACSDFEDCRAPASCYTVEAGMRRCQVAVGNSCQQDSDCYRSQCNNSVCVRVATPGEACRCDLCCEYNGLWCFEGTCRERRHRSAGESCQFFNDCQYNLGCDCKRAQDSAGDSTEACDGDPGMCTPFKELGEPCQSGDACLSDACQDGKCVQASGHDAPCQQDRDCHGDGGSQWLVCVAEKCQDLRNYRVDETYEGNFVCQDDDRYRGVVSPNNLPYCVPARAESEPCAAANECASRVCLDGICVAPRSEEQSCTVISSCAEGLYCDVQSRICVRKRALAEPCMTNYMCLSGLTCSPDSNICLDRCY